MRIRFWIGLIAVFLIGGGSIVAALAIHANETASFEQRQNDEADRSARQAESLAELSVGQLQSAAAFFRAEGHFTEHEFDVVAQPLIHESALNATGFVERVPAARRRAFEARHGVPILEPTPHGPRRARRHAEYFPVTYTLSSYGEGGPTGYDVATDPVRGPLLRRAGESGKMVASAPLKLLIGGLGVNVYRPVYRDGAPIATVAERRRALIGFAVGAFRISDLAAAANRALPGPVEVQIRVSRTISFGDPGDLEEFSPARIHIANRTLPLIVRDPNRPDITLPLMIGGIGISLAALLAALIVVWTRNERMQELKREAREDPLTGLENRRSFEEDLRREMARSRRQGVPGAMLMIDLDHFKRVNDTRGHPAGDELIREVAKILRRRVRESDVLARLGGDEFAIVLPGTPLAQAQTVAEAIVAAIAEHSGGNGDGVTASIGIAMFGDDPRLSAESLISEADTAMYAAKDGGRNGVRVFDPTVVRDAPTAE